MLDEELYNFFNIEQGVPQRCIFSPTLLQVFLNDILKIVVGIGKRLTVRKTSVPGMLFTDDLVGVSDTPERLEMEIDAAKGLPIC